MTVSVVIATKNRLAEVRRTCELIRQLNPPPLELIITADRCTDGTVEFIKSASLDAKLIVNEQMRGSVASRDHMIREAQGDLVLALDDDSYPEQLDCIARIVAFFEQRPKLAVLHFPQRTDEYPETLAQTDFRLGTFDAFVCQFRGGPTAIHLSPIARV